MNIRFDPLLTLEIGHAYYGGPCRDFTFVVPADTARVLASGRMMARALDGKLHVLIEKDVDGNVLASPAGRTLRFGLQLDNGCFGNFTDLPFSPGEFAALYTNSAVAGVLAGPVAVTVVGPKFRHALRVAARPLTLTVRRNDGSVVRTEAVTGEDGRASVSFDLSGAAPGAIVIGESATGEAAVETVCYLDAELANRAVFGVVEVTLAASFVTAPAEFRIEFAARTQQLKYYVVARRFSDDDLAQLAVSDAGFTAEARPEVVFEKVATSDWTTAELPRETLEDGDSRVVLFRSSAAVGRSQGGLKKLRLQRNGETLVENLPHPRPDSASADLVILVSKP